MLISLFNEIIEAHPEFKNYIPEVKESDVNVVLAKLNMKVKTQDIIDYIMNRYSLIHK